MPNKNTAAVCLAIAAIIGGATLPAPDGWPVDAMPAAGLSLAAIVLLATGALPMGVMAVGFLLFAMLLDVQPASVVFSGFATGAFWLVFGGLVVGVAVQHTGFGSRLARLFAARFNATYLSVLIGVSAAAMTLAFMMPSSMGRVVLLIPLVLTIADELGFEAGSRGRTGMVMAVCLISFAPSGAILPAHLGSVILAAQAETLYGIQFTYGGFLFTHFPVMGALRIEQLGMYINPDRRMLFPEIIRQIRVRHQVKPQMFHGGVPVQIFLLRR
jgi:di/tricarboxylate transporter